MPYQISFKSDTIPADLPDDAVIKRLPFEIRTAFSDKKIAVTTESFSKNVFLRVEQGPNVALNREEAKALARALTEAFPTVTYTEEPPPSVTQVKDSDGDVWTRRPGGWVRTVGYEETTPENWSCVMTWAPITSV